MSFTLCCLQEGHTCWGATAAGRGCSWWLKKPISYWHAKKSEIETRMYSRTRTERSFLTSCCNSDKCHQLVTKKISHHRGKKPGTCPSAVLKFISVLLSCFLPPLLHFSSSLFTLSGGCWPLFCLPGSDAARGAAPMVLAVKLCLPVAELKEQDWVEQLKHLAELKSLTAHLFCERSWGTFASLCISHPKGVCLAGAGRLSVNFSCMEGTSYVMLRLQCARDNAWDVSAHTQQKQPLCSCLALPPSRLLAQSGSAQRSSPELCSASFCYWHSTDGRLRTLHSHFLSDPSDLILIVA